MTFLTVCVLTLYNYDKVKLKLSLNYFHGMIYLPLISKTNSLNIIKLSVDVSYSIYWYCIGHTRATMLMEKLSVGGGSIIGSLLTDYWCTPRARNMVHAGVMFYIVRTYFARTQFGVNWHIYINVEDVPWHIITRILKVFLTHQPMYHDTLWHDRTNVSPFPDDKVLTRRMPYSYNLWYYWMTILQWRGIYTVCHISFLVYIKHY